MILILVGLNGDMIYVLTIIVILEFLYIFWITTVLHNMIQGLYKKINNLREWI